MHLHQHEAVNFVWWTAIYNMVKGALLRMLQVLGDRVHCVEFSISFTDYQGSTDHCGVVCFIIFFDPFLFLQCLSLKINLCLIL